ncbi:hypothetical protein [Jiangella gansuensis]|uniref:hypothetical protein n=1 Tax=Jiangella gansuensis TaxID=281473 RepID=UPI00047BDADD|nr:hypothetical protein [Jiangella gansuensis]
MTAWPVLRRYDADHSLRIALPLGGIGTATVSLGGRGDLRDWEVMNRPAKGCTPRLGHCHPGTGRRWCRGRRGGPWWATAAALARADRGRRGELADRTLTGGDAVQVTVAHEAVLSR